MLFFCQPNYQSILAIKTMLRCFEITSGLKVNFHKSQVGAIGVYDEDMVVFFNCLNCKIMELPFKYLGLTIGGNPRSVAFWKPVIDKIRSRLARWKGKLLSMAGRVWLIKSVINACLYFIYPSSKPLFPYVILSKESKLFLWGWGY